MKELLLSTIERDFILKAIAERKRLDGREAYQYRHMKIRFGVELGCCFVDLGNTKVMAQISCDISTPKDTRPSDGFLVVNVELSPMAAPHFEAGRLSEQAVEINRLLERCLRESRCLDTESLCIAAGLKVWMIRADVHILNYDGNAVDAASVAVIAALVHFRRPDVTVCGEDITIHSLTDRDPIPLSVLHMPVCSSFAFFDTGKFVGIDPTQREELVADGVMVIAMNKHREICVLQMSGRMLLMPEQVTRCASIAAVKAAEMTELIHSALEADVNSRAASRLGMQRCSYDTVAQSVELPRDASKVTATVTDVSPAIDMQSAEETALSVIEISDSDRDPVDESQTAAVLAPGLATVGNQKHNKIAHGVSVTAPMDTTEPSTDTSVVEISDSDHESVLVLDSGINEYRSVASSDNRQQAATQNIDLTVALKKKRSPNKPQKNRKNK